MILLRTALACAALLAAASAFAQPATVCTVTVNSPDERDALREYLPAEKYRFVELAELGKRDWLGRACREQVKCDVLVISGHFAGTDFYSSRHGEHLPVDEMERVACSDSCPGLFSQLKEVYLFGCDTLKSEPVRSAAPEVIRGLVSAGHSPAEASAIARELSLRHGESARDRMRRVFAGVPLIYGFSSLAPYGRVAGPMLRHYLQAGGVEEIGSGEPSSRLLKLFGPASMVATAGQRAGDADAPYRAEACRYYDDRVTQGGRIAFVRELLGGDAPTLRMNFDRIERFLSSLGEEQRSMAPDLANRANYLGVTRATRDPALRVRMIALARNVRWLDGDGERRELAALVGEMLADGSAGYGEVDLICGLSPLESELGRFDVARLSSSPANAAALACLGSSPARERVLKALASPDEREVQVAQAYLRHRPLQDGNELRAVVRQITAMKPSAAQARALETLARQPLADRQSFDQLTQLFARTPSLAVQRAIAEVFLRATYEPATAAELARVLRQRRIKSPGGQDLIDTLIRRLESA